MKSAKHLNFVVSTGAANPLSAAGDHRFVAVPIANARGFSALAPARRREIASMGGRAAQKAGTAHRFTQAEAQEAGRKGALAKKARANHKASGDAE